MRGWSRRITIGVLFAGLVAVLLWFQGILFRGEHAAVEVPGPPHLAASDRLAAVERRGLASVEVYPGFVEAIDPAELAPRVMATIVELTRREGEAVEAGETLVTLDDRDARARLSQASAAREAAAAQALQARLAFERAQRLLEVDALTTQEWEAARAAHDGARAQEERLAQAVQEAEAALSWFRLVAPFAGRVLERHADPGQLATPGRAVLALYREDALRFAVAVPEGLAAGLSPGASLELDFGPLPARRAELTRILPAADRATGTVTLHLALEPADDLRPGLLGRLRLRTGERQVLLVPAAAIERIGQVERVQLLRDGRLVPVTVRTGKAHGALVEVLSGLSEGEEVRLP